MKSWASILLWSVIAAAFIGPGTVTTAAAAGAGFGLALLWALAFSTVACYVLQEASGRLTIASNRSLGRVLHLRRRRGLRGWLMAALALGAILLGCAAYEAGNILGGVAGAVLATGGSAVPLTLICGALAALLLWFQSPRGVARLLSALVAVMGIAFLITAWRIGPDLGDLMRHSVVPVLPRGSGVIVLGLIGTTVVPYNIFLGSGLAAGQDLRELRLGLAVAIGLGGVISMAVLVVGTAVEETFNFGELSAVLQARLGTWSGPLFGVGLFGAGLSSAITAPLAAAVTARDLLGHGEEDERWRPRSWRYRAVWSGVLLTGLGFGLSDLNPIPVIILAQALNGILLPVVAVFLFYAVNDRDLLADRANGPLANVVMGAVVWVTLLLGLSATWRATARALALEAPQPVRIVVATTALSLILAVPMIRSARSRAR